MDQFVVSDDGQVYESAVRGSVGSLKSFFPEINPLVMEAHLMLERSHRLLASLRDAQWAEYGLTGSRFIVLRLLYTSEQRRTTMRQIGTQLNLGPSNVTQLIDGLVREGLVQRAVSEGDKRQVQAVLTPAGEELFEVVFPQSARRMNGSFSAFNDADLRQLSHLLSRLRRHLLENEARLAEVDHPGGMPAPPRTSRRRAKPPAVSDTGRVAPVVHS